VKGGDMNPLEKRSFYSFVALYVVSSYLFLGLSAYWYYTARYNALVNETFFRMEHTADSIGGEIINAHMHKLPLKLKRYDKDLLISLVDTKGDVVIGEKKLDVPLRPFRGLLGDTAVLISDAAREHMGIRHIVVRSERLQGDIADLRKQVTAVVVVVAILIALIGWMLSKLFLRPLRERMAYVERFVDAVAHELNTPVTALLMTTEKTLKEGKCDERNLKHIAVSTHQLHEIYRSLSFLSFGASAYEDKALRLDRILETTITRYRAMAEMKSLRFDVETEPFIFETDERQAGLLFGNLIGNAVKYSHRGGKITVRLRDGILEVTDEGIGIRKEKLDVIFEKYERATRYTGGFGIGLSVVKTICEHYRIDMNVVSEEGKGTRFTLRFPKVKG
jgi:two-component system OmpR family sensor kinase